MVFDTLPRSAAIKLELMFEGIRYSDALGAAAQHAFPNFYPYRFKPEEPDPTGTGKANIPYLLTFEDGTLSRIQGNGRSPWVVAGDRQAGYVLENSEHASTRFAIEFEPLPKWMRGETSDGLPMAEAGVSLHGDMAVVNVAPGCQYFTADKQDGVSMRCIFCTYGKPDSRINTLGQDLQRVELPDFTYRRMQETLQATLTESEIRHIYLVGGSMTDWRQEGERYIELARRVQEVVGHGVPVTCGSGALPDECLQTLHDQRLVDNVCFNLEVWSEALFAKVCPGKQRYVGYSRWIESLERAVALWGRERVYSAMVAGVELEPEFAMSGQAALELALQGAEDLCRRGVIPIYSLYWPVGGRNHPDYLSRLRTYFEQFNLGYAAIRDRYKLRISDGFMCHRCAYMQLEADIDRAASGDQTTSS